MLRAMEIKHGNLLQKEGKSIKIMGVFSAELSMWWAIV